MTVDDVLGLAVILTVLGGSLATLTYLCTRMLLEKLGVFVRIQEAHRHDD